MKKTYTKAVSATLASALAVGMVPAMALADEAVDQEMDLQVAGDNADLAAGEITKAYDQDGNVVDLSAAISFKANNTAQYVEPAVAVTKTGVVIDVDTDKHMVRYFQVSTAANAVAYDWAGATEKLVEVADASQITGVGTYYAVAMETAEADYNYGAAVKFALTANTLAGAYLVGGVDSDDLTQTELVWDGTALGNAADEAISLVDADGKMLTYGTDFTGTWVGNNPTTGTVGQYVFRAQGAGAYYENGKYYDIAINIKPLDLTNAEIVLNDYAVAQPAQQQVITVSTVNDVEWSVLSSGTAPEAALTFVASNGYIKNPMDTIGEFTYSIAAIDDNVATTPENVIGSKQVTVVRYTEEATIGYGLEAANGKVVAADKFNPALITVTDKDDAETALPHTVAYYKLNTITGEYVKVDDISKAGTYQAVVTVNSKDLGYTHGGKAVIDFSNSYSTIDLDKDAFVTFNGKLVENVDVVYDGTDVLESVKVEVRDPKTKAVLVEGTDYTVEVTSALTEKVVEKAVDAGRYALTIKPVEGSDYNFKAGSTATVEIDIAKVVLDKDNATAAISNTSAAFADNFTLLYTGKAITPSFVYDITATDMDVDYTKENWVELPAAAIGNVKYMYSKDGEATYVAVEEVKEVGYYRAIITDNGKEANYVADAVICFVVTDAEYFADVPTGKWYYDSVYEAVSLGYMNGYKGTKLFGPEAAMTRGQLMCVLFNMAGMEEGDIFGPDNETSGAGNIGADYKSFKDVDADAYYSEAIAWAKELGVANGHNGNFRPDDPVTREETAAFFANYAAVCGDYDAPTAAEVKAALAAYPDGAKVSGWAEEVVAWAVMNDVMGNGKTLNPAANIMRAEVAAMAVNYQPEAIEVLPIYSDAD